jgi:hypothetical protein
MRLAADLRAIDYDTLSEHEQGAKSIGSRA